MLASVKAPVLNVISDFAQRCRRGRSGGDGPGDPAPGSCEPQAQPAELHHLQRYWIKILHHIYMIT